MIVRGLKAENILKYRRLTIGELPERGLIAISGRNESGKSTIGETICFALFGRTFSLDSADIAKIIRWGESACSVRLVFTTREGERFQLARFLDVDGNHSARLTRDGDEEHPIARGLVAVDEALPEIVGYGFEEFIESFYLAQREITTPHPHSHAVKTMAGIAPLEQCAGELREELDREREAIAEAVKKIEDVDAQLELLAVEDGYLDTLESQRQALESERTDLQRHVETLERESAAYRQRLPRLRKTERRGGTASLLRWLSLLLALLLGGFWALVTYAPDSVAAQAAIGFMEQWSSGWHPGAGIWLLWGAGAFAALFALFWIRKTLVTKRLVALRAESAGLGEELRALQTVERGPETGGQSSVDASPPEAKDPGLGDTPQAMPGDPETSDRLRRRILEHEATAEEVELAVRRETEWMHRETERLRERLEGHEKALARERERIATSYKIKGMKEAFEKQVESHRHRIAVKEMADRLLLGASRQLSRRFNFNLRGLVGRTLPLFTENRYEHLQIGEELTVRVFSNEKRDFMELEEISSGTQRQIMLALRLALAQELINRVVKGRQFLFLDEPFAFFDEARTRSSLSVLPGLSEELGQIWIVAQQFPEDMELSLRVGCSREDERLNAGRSPYLGAQPSGA